MLYVKRKSCKDDVKLTLIALQTTVPIYKSLSSQCLFLFLFMYFVATKQNVLYRFEIRRKRFIALLAVLRKIKKTKKE